MITKQTKCERCKRVYSKPLSELTKVCPACRFNKISPLTRRQKIGQKYWETLCINQRVALIEAHGGFSRKHADQEYQDLTGSLQEIANEAAITPGGIVPMERLIKLRVLNRTLAETMLPEAETMLPEYWWYNCPSLNEPAEPT